jgi:nucleoside-diphosphate-sugar epimerase
MDKPAALVTGASTGIGRSAAVALARSGYDVAINYSRSGDAAKITAHEVKAAGAKALLCRADVSDDASARSMIAAVEREFGRLDVLINNAGTTVDIAPTNFEEMTVDAWNRVFSVNVLGVFLVTRAAAPLLKKSPNGCIVNTCSIAGLRPSAQPLPYGEQSGGGEPDEDIGQCTRSEDPRQCRSAWVDRRRMDETDPGRELRRSHGTASEVYSAQALLHGRRRCGQHVEFDPAQSVRHRRDHYRRRRLFEHDIEKC